VGRAILNDVGYVCLTVTICGIRSVVLAEVCCIRMLLFKGTLSENWRDFFACCNPQHPQQNGSPLAKYRLHIFTIRVTILRLEIQSELGKLRSNILFTDGTKKINTQILNTMTLQKHAYCNDSEPLFTSNWPTYSDNEADRCRTTCRPTDTWPWRHRQAGTRRRRRISRDRRLPDDRLHQHHRRVL